MLDLKIQTAVLKQLGIGIFRNVDGHFFDHEIGQEQDHLSSLIEKGDPKICSPQTENVWQNVHSVYSAQKFAFSKT